jgi:hypothetical protein
MNITTVRSILALIVVGTFMLITATLLIYPFVSKDPVSLGPYSDYFNKTASAYTGIVGVVIGYYFGNSGGRKGKQVRGNDAIGEAAEDPDKPV